MEYLFKSLGESGATVEPAPASCDIPVYQAGPPGGRGPKLVLKLLRV